MGAARVGNRMGRMRWNPGRQHLAGADVTGAMQRQYERILASLRERHEFRTDAKRKSVAAATVRKLAQRNPGDYTAAERLAERFHGRPAVYDMDLIEREEYDEFSAILGPLVEIVIPTEDLNAGFPIRFKYNPDRPETNVLLVSNPEGTNLEFVGGDQDVPDWQDIEGADTADDKYLVMIGPVFELSYFADKHHLGGPRLQKIGMEYFHELEELPWLVLDRRNKKLWLVGGSYKVRPEGITG